MATRYNSGRVTLFGRSGVIPGWSLDESTDDARVSRVFAAAVARAQRALSRRCASPCTRACQAGRQRLAYGLGLDAAQQESGRAPRHAEIALGGMLAGGMPQRRRLPAQPVLW